MIRRFSAALIGLALCLPIFAVMPVAAHGGGFTVVFTEQGDDDIVGWVVNHQSSRQSNVIVTGTWENGVTDITETGGIFISNLAPHSASPFRLDPSAAVAGKTLNSVTAAGQTTGTKPTGGLHVNACTFTGDVCNGSVTNDGSGTALNVKVAGTRGTPTTPSDAAESAAIPTLAAGATAAYSITFAGGSTGTIQTLIAKTNPVTPPGGNFYTSWNNYFSDLSNTSEGFVADIAFMADENITQGCGAAIFCPKDNVSRAAMAVFLDNALGLTDALDQGFTDIGGLSAAFQQAINNVAAAGITDGCSVTPKKYCPNNVVSRGQMSKFIVTAYGLTPLPCPDGESCTFTDDDDNFSEPYNEAMFDAEITTGCAADRYCPNSAVLREQMAVFIHRAELLP